MLTAFTIGAMAISIATAISAGLLILELATAWKVFEKYGEPGWKGLIPFYSDIVEFGKVWSTGAAFLYIIAVILASLDPSSKGGTLGIISGIAGLAAFVINVVFASKKSKAFGRGFGLTLLLVFFPFVGNICIGFNKDIKYLG